MKVSRTEALGRSIASGGDSAIMGKGKYLQRYGSEGKEGKKRKKLGILQKQKTYPCFPPHYCANE